MSSDYITYSCDCGTVIKIPANLYFKLSDEDFIQYVQEECYTNGVNIGRTFSEEIDLDNFNPENNKSFFEEDF